MAEIITSKDWLEATQHCVLEHWCDADAWLWNAPEGNRCKPNTQRWKGFQLWMKRFDHYDRENPVHVAIYNALMFHLEPESAPKDSTAPEWSHGVRPKDEFIQGLERLINGEPAPESEVVAVSENLPDYEDLPIEVIKETSNFQPFDDAPVRPMRSDFEKALSYTGRLSRKALCPLFKEMDILWTVLNELEDVAPDWTNQEVRISEWFANACCEVEELLEAHQRKTQALKDAVPDKDCGYTVLLERMFKALLRDNRDQYEFTSAVMRQKFRQNDKQLMPDLLGLLRDHYGAKEHKVGAIDLSKVTSLKYTLPGFWPRGGVTHWFGGSTDGKTSTALGAARAVIHGTGFLDQEFPGSPGKVLFVQADAGAPRFKAEFEKLGMDVDPLIAERFEVWAPDAEQGVSGFKASIPGFIQIRKALEEKQFDAVIIDSVKGMCSGTGFDYADNASVNSLVTMLRESIAMPCKCAIVLINHLGVDQNQGAGAKAWSEAADQTVQFKSVQGRNANELLDIREIVVWKDPVYGRRAFHTTIEDGLHVCTDGTAVVKNKSDLVLKFFRDQAREGRSRWQLKDLKAQIKDVASASVERAVADLSGHGGQLRKVRRGVYELKGA